MTISFAATWMDLETIILNEFSQTVKDKHHISLIGGIQKKKDTYELIYRTETSSQTLKNLPKETGGRMGWGIGIGICTLRYRE